MGKYQVTIGLEIHAELNTATKMFCASKNDPDEEAPNVNICPICMGHPGTLPVINKHAVQSVLKVGLALGGKLATFTEFDRKNYFYPDIPKGYQISQYKYPLVSGGSLQGVTITRVHLEEDTARSTHDAGDYSLVDFNRAGVPLMELVTEPVIHSAKEAVSFAKELQLLLRTLGIAEANMEKGEMRVEANISVAPEGSKTFGTKTEVKNLNSFKVVEKAIEYEVARHIEIIEAGEKVVQETRGWDDVKAATYGQRMKESSHDYRYFPDPDLPKLQLNEVPELSVASLSASMPELPWQKRDRLKASYGLKPEDVELFVGLPELGSYFEEVTAEIPSPELVKLASNYIISDYLGLIKKNVGENEIETEIKRIPSLSFAELIKMLSVGDLSSRGAKDTLKIMYEEGGEPRTIAEAKGLIQKNDEGELKKVMEAIVSANPKVVEDYRKGKEAALQFLVGQGMKQTRGGANPGLLKKVLLEVLNH